ncbi:23S rRNA (adenine(2503)-C(2))-methyltransferase RlmN [bacterium]|nr:23S rRNA (adenine(2503)-C(2))-methyltransferase RlmN [bacterium]
MKKKNVFNLSPTAWQAFMREWQEPAYRSNQIIAAAWNPKIADFSLATSLPKNLREKLNVTFFIPRPLVPVKKQISEDKTVKALFILEDKSSIESVAIPKDNRLTFCLSTQVGCAMGCSFCATAQLGLKRHLSSAEIIAQIRSLIALLGQQPTNLVFMGMGEPLQNLNAVRSCLEIITHPKAMNWSPHKSIISTCGWVPGIEAITTAPLKAKLALSLNAVNNTLRNKLMPINRRFPLEKVLPAIQKYSQATGEQVSIEYLLLHGVNDRLEDAACLGRLLKNYNVKINIIPYNPVAGLAFKPPTEKSLAAFLHELRKSRILITLRTSRGKTIGAACGQLAGQKIRKTV